MLAKDEYPHMMQRARLANMAAALLCSERAVNDFQDAAEAFHKWNAIERATWWRDEDYKDGHEV